MKHGRNSIFYLFLLILSFYFHLACASYKILKAPIDQNSQKFLDLIRYLITPQEENGQFIYYLRLKIEVINVELKSTYGEKKDIRETLSLENLRKNIREKYSINEKITIPLEKGTNKIYFSVRDKTQQKRLRKLNIIKIK